MKKTIKICISYASIIKEIEKENKYVNARDCENNGKIITTKGNSTNLAPIISLLPIDYIILISSESARKKVEIINMTSVDYLRSKIMGFCQENKIREPMDPKIIKIKDVPEENDVSRAVFRVYDEIVKIVKENGNKNVELYIESNGGPRYVLTMLLSIMGTLETTYSNVIIKEIIGMVKEDDKTRIRNLKDIFDTSQVTTIVDEFVKYGKITRLMKYYEQLKDAQWFDQNQLNDMGTVINTLSKATDDIQLCRTNLMLYDFYSKKSCLVVINRFIGKYKNDDSLSVFIHLLKIFKTELPKKIDNDKVIYGLPNLIEWCMEKDFIQQALTLCVERIPQYLFETKRIKYGSDNLIELINEKNSVYETNYYFFNNLDVFLNKEEREYFENNGCKDDFIKICKKMKEKVKLQVCEKWIEDFSETKWNFKNALKINKISIDNGQEEDLQLIVYKYYLCKKMRNETNHANDDGNNNSLDIIKKFMKSFIYTIKGFK